MKDEKFILYVQTSDQPEPQTQSLDPIEIPNVHVPIWKPDSLSELSIQVILALVPVIFVALIFEGGAGFVAGSGEVVPLAALEKPDSPAVLCAVTLYQ